MTAAQAHPARQPVERILWMVLLGWLFPGLGHFGVGQRKQGAFLLFLIGGVFLTGLL